MDKTSERQVRNCPYSWPGWFRHHVRGRARIAEEQGGDQGVLHEGLLRARRVDQRRNGRNGKPAKAGREVPKEIHPRSPNDSCDVASEHCQGDRRVRRERDGLLRDGELDRRLAG